MKKSPSFLATILNFSASAIDRFAWRFGKVNRFETKGESIIVHRGLVSVRTIQASEIKRWNVHEEMGFDIVRIDFFDEQVVTWIDKRGDLLAAMRRLVPTKENNE